LFSAAHSRPMILDAAQYARESSASAIFAWING
jgi:hypothetical protein